MINRNAIFSDETQLFKTPFAPCQGERVVLRIRTLSNDVIHAYAVINGVKREMHKIAAEHREVTFRKEVFFDYFEVAFKCPEKKVAYYFVLEDEDEQVFFNRLGCIENAQDEYNFSFVPGFDVPEWALGIVFYQIFPDRFLNGDPSNDVEDNEYYYTGGHSRRIREWDKLPDELDVRNFYGGDLQGG